MWFDSHCHLNMCEENEPLERLLDRAAEAGVTRMVTVGIDRASNRRAIEIAESHSGVYASVGLHPNDSTQWSRELADEVEAMLGRSSVVAVGESGLDFYRDRAPRDTQEEVFRHHIDLATRHDKALIIHTRDSVDAALDVLDVYGTPARLVFHCWSGDRDELDRALRIGGYISFAGNVSFKSADGLRDIARLVPSERLLVETDSPFLTPEPQRGKPNGPAYVPLVGGAVATARDQDLDDLAQVTAANASALFGLS